MSSIQASYMPVLTEKKEHILNIAAGLFAERGYAAVSMRDLANELHMTPAALYHHYTGKDSLYYATLEYIFTGKAEMVSDLLDGDEPADVRLEQLIRWFVELFSGDKIVTRLLHRELLLGDDVRLKLLSEQVIEAPFREVEKLMQQLCPQRDARLSAESLIALIMGYFELQPIFEKIAGHGASADKLSTMTSHVKAMILCGQTDTFERK